VKLGVTFPQTEIGNDPIAIRDFAQTVEGLGFDFLNVYDHVLSAPHSGRSERLTGPYTERHPFHEVFVLFGYLAAHTQRLELFTHVLVLPQRQTALVAKQAAEVDVLSGGRLRLGVGIGWNFVEYEALGFDFHRRGRRLDEQIEVLQALWTNDLVDIRGREHRIDRAGLNPLPVQRPIPLWFGGAAEPLLRRAGRYGAGWMPNLIDLDQVRALRARVDAYAREAGRDPAQIGLFSGAGRAGQTPDDWAQRLESRKALGVTYATFLTMDAGLASVAAHLDAVRRFKETADGVLSQ
jgi:probable F420-dependent oxidoreductase